MTGCLTCWADLRVVEAVPPLVLKVLRDGRVVPRAQGARVLLVYETAGYGGRAEEKSGIRWENLRETENPFDRCCYHRYPISFSSGRLLR